MPKYGSGNLSALAYEINTEYWDWFHSVDTTGTVDSGARYWASNGSTANITVNISELQQDQQDLTKQALQVWQDVANITISYTTGAADITYNDFTKADGSASAGTTETVFYDALTNKQFLTGATVDISRNWDVGPGGFNNYFFQTIVHETGHALGLGHPGDYNGGKTNSYYNTDSTIYANDTWQWSVMSYNDQAQYGTPAPTVETVLTPQMADIYAVQATYGAATTRSGDTVYGFHSNAGSIYAPNFYDFASYPINDIPAFTIYDSAGTDTLDCSGFNVAQTIDLRGGNWSSIGGKVDNIGIYTSVVIENAIGGSGNDTITGNDASNSLDGGLGADHLDGGNGDDYLTVDPNGGDVLDGGAGFDTMVLKVPTIASWQTGQLAPYISSDSWLNWEAIQGSSGNDVIRTNSWGYAVELLGGAGNDILATGVDGVVNDTLFGQNGDDRLSGGAGNDRLYGGAGNDILDGGPGSDYLNGGTGNDIYYVDTDFDQVREAAGGGVDTVYASATFTLHATLAEVEWLATTNAAGTAAINLTGSDFSNRIIGNAGANVINGRGGNDFLYITGGADVLDGGDGFDTIVFQHATVASWQTGVLDADIASTSWLNWEAIQGSSGDDIIRTNSWGFSITLLGGAGNDILATGASDFVNNTLYGQDGNDTLSGGAGNDRLWGGNGNDILDGQAGADLMGGGAGNDTYLVDNSLDRVLESVGGGTDTVFASANYALQAGQEVEFLRANAGATGLILNGNEFDNAIVGGTGNDTFNGGNGNDTLNGGDGNDTLRGGAGNDVLSGGNGNDLLDGQAGADLMAGGAGNDTYLVDNSLDKVLESVGGGTDTVFTSVNYALQAGQEVEFLRANAGVTGLVLTGNEFNNLLVGLTGNDNLNGGIGNDTLNGADGNDTLNGGNGNDGLIGGNGNDVLNGMFGIDLMAGGAGNDTFAWNAPTEGGDNITDFKILGTDVLQFNAAAFGFVPGHVLVNGSEFIANNAPVANHAGPTFLMNTSLHNLSFDANGTGAGGPVLIAHMNADAVASDLHLV